MSVTTSYFMGANSPCGFYSLFEEIYNPYKSVHPYIIKGGPGTGKSTVMKKIAETAQARDYDTELIYCSSDSSSLDAVIVKDLGLSVIDGTSPHTLEPKFPGAVENIINTGDFWNKRALSEKRDIIRTLTLENSICHRTSAKYLSAAGAVKDEGMRLLSSFIKEEKVNSFALRFAMREAPKKKNSPPGKRIRRFISGITPTGVTFLDGTVKTLAARIIGINDGVGAVSGLVCQRIGDIMIRNGYDVIFCQCPMNPKGDCEHIIIPEISLAIITVKSEHNSALECDRLIHSERFLLPEFKQYKQKIRWSRKISQHLIEESIKSLSSAKSVHDKLEGIYISAMDFEALNKYTDKLTEEIFSL